MTKDELVDRMASVVTGLSDLIESNAAGALAVPDGARFAILAVMEDEDTKVVGSFFMQQAGVVDERPTPLA